MPKEGFRLSIAPIFVRFRWIAVILAGNAFASRFGPVIDRLERFPVRKTRLSLMEYH
jgi:hypothetical protein